MGYGNEKANLRLETGLVMLKETLRSSSNYELNRSDLTFSSHQIREVEGQAKKAWGRDERRIRQRHS